MHELHLLRDLLADVLKHAQANGLRRVTAVHLRLGEFTEIDPEILREFFREHSRGTAAETAALHIENGGARELRLLSIDGD